ncbi:MAG: hypothetical protein EOO01_24895 [Chitinophagaceae bacterium]|nr:MAG: hypothetical protein EOO01_24895 [Chitinophagaceae bacterium]
MANETDVELESPFIGYRDKGHTIQLEGLDTTVKPSAFRIKLTRKNGESETYFFDNKDFSLVRKKTLSTNDEMDKAPLDVIYSDYKTTGNIKMPHKISTSTNGQPVLTIIIERVDINLPMKAGIFNP